MTLNWLEWAVFALAAGPASLFLWNLWYFRRLRGASGEQPAVSVLIPARNEESSIEASVESVLASRGVTIEVIVLDDHSTDRTADLVRRIAARDPRVRCEIAPKLPPDWCGKQHASFVLATLARHPILCFLDADVRLDLRGLSRMTALLRQEKAALVSGFPRQITGTLAEKLLIPLIHFVLLGYLPLVLARHTRFAAFGAGCGQLMMTTADAYWEIGGHQAIRSSLHDGIKLPRAFRKASRRTAVFDATDVAWCRMYRSAIEVWFGLAKNATEGMAGPVAIFVFTALLAGGQLAPFGLLALSEPTPLLWATIGCVYLPRVLAAVRFRQPWTSVLFHPFGVALLLSIQWFARVRAWLGRPATWKSRSYAPSMQG